MHWVVMGPRDGACPPTVIAKKAPPNPTAINTRTHRIGSSFRLRLKARHTKVRTPSRAHVCLQEVSSVPIASDPFRRAISTQGAMTMPPTPEKVVTTPTSELKPGMNKVIRRARTAYGAVTSA